MQCAKAKGANCKNHQRPGVDTDMFSARPRQQVIDRAALRYSNPRRPGVDNRENPSGSPQAAKRRNLDGMAECLGAEAIPHQDGLLSLSVHGELARGSWKRRREGGAPRQVEEGSCLGR